MHLLDYSGVVLNQNTQATNNYTWDGHWVYQTFTLPSDLSRGFGTPGERIPDLTGIQVCVTVDNGQSVDASLNYVVQYYGGDNDGWVPLTEGAVTGTPNSGPVWVNLVFPQSVPIPEALLTKQFRFGIQATAHISSFQYVSPTPLIRVATGQGQVYASDGFTPLVAPSSASLNFRILAMTADRGVNFLGNQYRSLVVLSAPGNVTTADGQTPVVGSGQSSYWLSPPQPSRFAVQSLYFDVRPVPTIPEIAALNLIGNPSFEYDQLDHAPQWWSAFSNGGTVVDQSVKSAWAYDRSQSLHMSYTFSGTNQQRGVISPLQPIAPTVGGQPTSLSISAEYNLLSFTNAELVLTVLFYDNTQTLLPNPYGTASFTPSSPSVGTGGWNGTITAPANANYVKFMVTALSTGAGSIQAYVDAIQVTLTDTVQPYFDGDDVNSQWTDQRGQSASVKLVTPTQDNHSVVIDGILLDPLTPNMAFNVYYTEDDSHTNAHMTEDDWEQKLWTRVPKTFTCTQRQQYVFPKPIVGKYMKVEFTNLQAQSYDPGHFSKPIKYKKFPTWVAEYFLRQMEFASFVVSRVDVQLDALKFAYDYYLDDLHQSPETPVPPSTDAINQLSSYFAPANAAGNIDPTTLGKINLAMRPFQLPFGTNVDANTSLGSFVTNLYGTSSSGTAPNTSTQPTVFEGGTIPVSDFSLVSSVNRDSLVFEQSMPVMYFFVTSRHGYKELSAPFQYHRAYFAGVKEVSFIRNDYTITSDNEMYNELGSDTTNTELNEWTLDSDGIWHTY